MRRKKRNLFVQSVGSHACRNSAGDAGHTAFSIPLPQATSRIQSAKVNSNAAVLNSLAANYDGLLLGMKMTAR